MRAVMDAMRTTIFDLLRYLHGEDVLVVVGVVLHLHSQTSDLGLCIARNWRC